MKNIIFSAVFFLLSTVALSNIIPTTPSSNRLYYKLGGASDFVLPPVSDHTSIRLDSRTNLGMGLSCSAFNPALSITNSINNIRDSIDNLEKSIIVNATGSLIQFPMYLLAQANPTAYNLLNNKLLSAHNELDVSTKSCERVRDQISQGKNPYQDWGTLAVGDQWKQHLTLVSSGNEDINHTKKEIAASSGNEGLPWVQGKNTDSSPHAGGKSQPPIHVIADTVKAGYNVMLNRDLMSDADAPDLASDQTLREYFQNPAAAIKWITSVLGDEVVTTCNDDSCKKQQGTQVGHGLLPWVTSCPDNHDDCVDAIREHFGNLVTGNEPVTKNNLEKVSAEGIAVSPEIIASIRNMDKLQQKMLIGKLSQEVAVQRVMDRAFVARNILSTGAQVPVIAANHPAQVVIGRAITNLDNDIRSLAFEREMRKQSMSATLSEILGDESEEQQRVMDTAPVMGTPALMEEGAFPASTSR